MVVKEISNLIFSVLSYSNLRFGGFIPLWSPLNTYEVKTLTIEKDLVKIEVEQCNANKLVEVVAYTDYLSPDDYVRVIERYSILWEGEVIDMWKQVPEALVHRCSNGVTVNIYIA